MLEEDYRVLVVEDYPNTRELYSAGFRMKGHCVDTAKDGVEALVMLGKNRYDIVLTDGQMPRMGGEELIRRIRDEGLLSPGAHIFLASSDPDIVDRLRDNPNITGAIEKNGSPLDTVDEVLGCLNGAVK